MNPHFGIRSEILADYQIREIEEFKVSLHEAVNFKNFEDNLILIKSYDNTTHYHDFFAPRDQNELHLVLAGRHCSDFYIVNIDAFNYVMGYPPNKTSEVIEGKAEFLDIFVPLFMVFITGFLWLYLTH